MPSEAVRAYIYRILLALAPLLVAYGLITNSLVGLWLVVAEAILGLGLAAANSSTKKQIPDGDGKHRAEV